MKLKFSKDRPSGATTLVAQLRGTEWVDHMNAQWLGTHTTPVLLRARYELEHHTTRLYYNTTGYVALPKYFRRNTLEPEGYANFLASICQVLEVVQYRNIAPQNILWSPRHIFVWPDSGLPAFGLLPSQINVVPGKNSPQRLLRFVLRPKHLSQSLNVAQRQKLQQLSHVEHIEPALLRQHLLEIFGEPDTSSDHTTGLMAKQLQQAAPTEGTTPQPSPRATSPQRPANTSTDHQTTSRQRPHSNSAASRDLEVLPSDSTVLAQPHQPENFAGAQAATLTITRIADRHRVQLTGSSVSIGRSKLADVHAGSHTDISRIHAFLTVEKDQIFLTDNHSTNGTWTTEETLQPGAQICLGKAATFWLGGEEFHVTLEHHPHERT